MAESSAPIQEFPPNAERRIHARRRIRSLVYVELCENNGGIVLNIGEGGFAVRAAEAIAEDRLPGVRFQTQDPAKPLVAASEIAWTSASRKEAGLRFVDLPETVLAEIKTWIALEDSPVNFRKPNAPAGRQSLKVGAAPKEPLSDSVPGGKSVQIAGRTVGEKYISKSSILRQPKTESSSTQLAAKSEKLPVNWMDFRIRVGAGWVLVAFMVFLASLSFAAGMAFRRGDLVRLPWMAKEKPPEQNEIPAILPNPAPSAASKPWNIEILDSTNRRWSIPGKSAANSSSAHAEGAPLRNQQADPSVAASGAPPNTPSSPPADGKKAPVLLNFPETSLSASGSVAISSQRSVSLPAGSSDRSSQPGKNIHVGQLVNLIEPNYPPDAQKNHIEGTVNLRAIIGTDGAIKDLQPLSGPPSLLPAALSAVREWRYNPTLLNGQPIETQEDIRLVFRLPK